jgi:hypothetical protein
MTIERDSQPVRFRPSARDLYYTGSGQPVPPPTDDEIAKVISNALYRFVDTSNPAVQAALVEAARKVRDLFPTTTNAVAKDSI